MQAPWKVLWRESCSTFLAKLCSRKRGTSIKSSPIVFPFLLPSQLLSLPYCIFNFCIALELRHLSAPVVTSSKLVEAEWLIKGYGFLVLRTTFTSKEDLWFLFVCSVFVFCLCDTVSERSNFWEDRFVLAHSLGGHNPSWQRDMAAEALQQGGGLRQLLVAEYWLGNRATGAGRGRALTLSAHPHQKRIASETGTEVQIPVWCL